MQGTKEHFFFFMLQVYNNSKGEDNFYSLFSRWTPLHRTNSNKCSAIAILVSQYREKFSLVNHSQPTHNLSQKVSQNLSNSNKYRKKLQLFFNCSSASEIPFHPQQPYYKNKIITFPDTFFFRMTVLIIRWTVYTRNITGWQFQAQTEPEIWLLQWLSNIAH